MRSVIFARRFKKPRQALVVDLHLKLFVEAIEHLGPDAALEGIGRLGILVTHALGPSRHAVNREDKHLQRLRK
jgi:hypothetical protein